MDRGNIIQGNNDNDNNIAMGRGNIVSPSVPEFRSVQVGLQKPQLLSPAQHPAKQNAGGLIGKRPASIGGMRESEAHEVIDTSAYFEKAGKVEVQRKSDPESKKGSNWIPLKLRPVPAFYPLEKSSRLVEDELSEVAGRLSDCMRVLSVQALYNNETATACLMTSENVEMYLSLWKPNSAQYPNGIVVELQRRKGDSIAFHRYSRFILDAAIGDFDASEHIQKYGYDMDFMQSKKLQRLLNMDMDRARAAENENAVIAIEIAHSLLMKDRMDARQLGLESLCLLTDPRKTSIATAVITSHVVLLGSAGGLATDGEDLIFDEAPFQEIREAILSLVQFSRIGEDEFGEEGGDDDFDGLKPVTTEGEHMSLLHNLALAVLANALDVIENQERFDDCPENTDMKPAATPTESSSSIAEKFMNKTHEMSKVEILATLIKELGKAEKNPHNAHLSAKCIGSLCRASEDAKNKAKELGAKKVLTTALDVGVRTHLKLETECKKVEEVLTSGNNEEPE